MTLLLKWNSNLKEDKTTTNYRETGIKRRKKEEGVSCSKHVAQQMEILKKLGPVQ